MRASWGPSGGRPSSGAGHGDLPGDTRAQDGQHEQHAGDDDLGLGGDVPQAHHVLQGSQQEHAGDRAAEGAPAAVEVDAAQQHGRDDGQFEAGGVVVAGAGVVQRPEDAGEGRHQAGGREQDQLLPPDADAGEPRGLLAGADREQRPAEQGGVQGDDGDGEQHQEGQEGVRDERVADASGGEVQVGGGEVGDRVGAEHDLRDAPVGGEGADGDGERGQSEAGHQQAVDQAAHDAEEQAERDDRLDGHALVPQGAHHRAGQPCRGRHGQVDLAGHHEQRHGQGDERDRQGVADEERQVEGVAEAVDGGERQQQDDHEQGADDRVPANGARQGVRHGGRSSSSGRRPRAARRCGRPRWRGRAGCR